MRERERQLEAERIAATRAGEALNALAENGLSNTSEVQKQSAFEDHTPMDSPQIGNRALNAVLTALSNYNDEDNEENSPRNGWGIESEVEGSRLWDRPIVLHGSDGILTKHPHHTAHTSDEPFHSPYRVMEDLDAIDRMCIQEGSAGLPAYNWMGAIYDSRQELAGHLKECWREIIEDEESGRVEKFLLICEFPVTLLRKVG
jgi:sodium/potassium/calcium exchanger 6